MRDPRTPWGVWRAQVLVSVVIATGVRSRYSGIFAIVAFVLWALKICASTHAARATRVTTAAAATRVVTSAPSSVHNRRPARALG